MEQSKTSVGRGVVRHPDGASTSSASSDEATSPARAASDQAASDQAASDLAATQAADQSATPAAPVRPRVGLVSAAALPAVVGGLTGALCAVVAVLAILALQPPLDARLPALAQQVGGFQQELYSLETAVRTVEVDVVRALDADRALSQRQDSQAESIDAAVSQMAAARDALQVESGTGSVIFGVAVVQLANAVATGGSFDSEWVTLYTLSRGDEVVRASLSRLMPMANQGVPTVETLRADLQAKATEAGVPIIDPSDLYAFGMNTLQSSLGLPLGTTAETQVASGLLTAADRHLDAGDVTAALEELGKLTESVAAPFQSWMDQARQRALADEEAAALMSLSTEALRARARG